MSTKKEYFIKSVYPYAVKSADILRVKGITVDPRYIVAQWAHETGYGRNTGTKYNNLAGIFAYPSSPYGISGRKYESLDDFVVDYTATLANKRYSAINNTGSVTEFASALKAGGYATDPNYAYARTWQEAFGIASNLGGSSTDTITKAGDPPKWYQLWRYDNDGKKVVVPWKDFFLGTTIEKSTGDDGKTDWVVRDNTKLDSDPSKNQSLISAESNWMDFVKLGFFQFMIFLLVVFFLYGALIKGSTIDDLGKAGVKIATKGMV